MIMESCTVFDKIDGHLIYCLQIWWGSSLWCCCCCLKTTTTMHLLQNSISRLMWYPSSYSQIDMYLLPRSLQSIYICCLQSHCQGFIHKGGGGWNPLPPPEIFKLSMVIIVLSQVLTHYTLNIIFYKSFWGYWYLAWAASPLLLWASTGNFS